MTRSSLVGAACLLLAGCFGTETQPQTPQQDMLEGTPKSGTREDPSQKTDAPHERKGNTYDKKLAQEAMNRAVRQAAECPKIHTEGPFGEVAVKVQISAEKGRVHDAVLNPPFAGTAVGKCIEKAFEAEILTPWSGPDETLDAKVTLKQPEAAKKDEKDGKKDPKKK